MPPPDAPTVSAVVPLFDERDNLPELYRRLTDTLREAACGPFLQSTTQIDRSTPERRHLVARPWP